MEKLNMKISMMIKIALKASLYLIFITSAMILINYASIIRNAHNHKLKHISDDINCKEYYSISVKYNGIEESIRPLKCI